MTPSPLPSLEVFQSSKFGSRIVPYDRTIVRRASLKKSVNFGTFYPPRPPCLCLQLVARFKLNSFLANRNSLSSANCSILSQDVLGLCCMIKEPHLYRHVISIREHLLKKRMISFGQCPNCPQRNKLGKNLLQNLKTQNVCPHPKNDVKFRPLPKKKVRFRPKLHQIALDPNDLFHVISHCRFMSCPTVPVKEKRKM